MPSVTTPLAPGPGRRRRGRPESEDLPSASTPDPSRKEASCSGSPSSPSPRPCSRPQPTAPPRTKLSGFTPNAEAVIGYHPDLVVIAYDPNGLAKALAKAHVRVLVQASAH